MKKGQKKIKLDANLKKDLERGTKWISDNAELVSYSFTKNWHWINEKCFNNSKTFDFKLSKECFFTYVKKGQNNPVSNKICVVLDKNIISFDLVRDNERL